MSTFESTRWSLVSCAREQSPRHREAFDALCHIYWSPVFAFVRRQGYSFEDARDLTQELFTNILTRDGFASANPEKGRFRSFLLAAVKNLLHEFHRKKNAIKRGGDVQTFSIDWGSAEDRMAWEPVETRTPEELFEYRWACDTIAEAMAELDRLNQEPTRLAYYQRLRSVLTMSDDAISYRDLATQFNVSESAIRVQVHRLRRKFREVLRQLVADTLADPTEVDEEIAYLMRCLKQG